MWSLVRLELLFTPPYYKYEILKVITLRETNNILVKLKLSLIFHLLGGEYIINKINGPNIEA